MKDRLEFASGRQIFDKHSLHEPKNYNLLARRMALENFRIDRLIMGQSRYLEYDLWQAARRDLKGTERIKDEIRRRNACNKKGKRFVIAPKCEFAYQLEKTAICALRGK